MSDATLDQHSKSQTSDRIQNGFDSKELIQEDFTSYLPQQHGYGVQPTDHYIQSYYGQMAFPYMGEWSTAGESVPYLSGYNSVGNGEPPHSFMQDAMFGQQPGNMANGQAYFNPPVFQQANDFAAWSSPAAPSSSLDTGLGHQSAPNAYNGDFYHPMMPSMPQDYLGRNEIIGNPSAMGGMPGHGTQSGMMPGGMSSGDGMSKMAGSQSPLKVIEHGIHGLSVSNMGGDPEQLVGKGNPSQAAMNAALGPPENGNVQNSYGAVPVAAKIAPPNNSAPSVSKPISWAAIASKPAKPQPKPKAKPTVGPGLPPPIKHNMDIGSWDTTKAPPRAANLQMPGASGHWNSPRVTGSHSYENGSESSKALDNYEKEGGDSKTNSNAPSAAAAHPVLDKLKLQNEYNPKRLTIDLRNSRFFVIKSYSEDDIHRSIKYNIWCSTEHGNKRLDTTFRAQKNRGPVILLYSVNGSGHFCGVAEMKTCVDYSSRAGVWSQDKWKGKFQVKWIYVKDVPNTVLRHIRLENNDNKPVTNSRDTQEVPAEKGRQVLKIIANYKHQTSIFDDFGHYERRQQEEETQRNRAAQAAVGRERKPMDGQSSSTRKAS